jgi:hypothetical protein
MSPAFTVAPASLGPNLCVVIGQQTMDGTLRVVVNSDPHEHPAGQPCASLVLLDQDEDEFPATGTDP